MQFQKENMNWFDHLRSLYYYPNQKSVMGPKGYFPDITDRKEINKTQKAINISNVSGAQFELSFVHDTMLCTVS